MLRSHIGDVTAELFQQVTCNKAVTIELTCVYLLQR